MEPTAEVMPLVSVGLGLAAACGLRVFLPLLAVGIAAREGWVTLSDGFAWLASPPALIVFGTATVAEVAGAVFVVRRTRRGLRSDVRAG